PIVGGSDRALPALLGSARCLHDAAALRESRHHTARPLFPRARFLSGRDLADAGRGRRPGGEWSRTGRSRRGSIRRRGGGPRVVQRVDGGGGGLARGGGAVVARPPPQVSALPLSALWVSRPPPAAGARGHFPGPR